MVTFQETVETLGASNQRNIENLIWVLWENLVLRKVYQKLHQVCNLLMRIIVPLRFALVT